MKKRLQQLTLDEKIGQLLVIGFPQNNVNHSLEETIRKYHFGNIILFQRNIVDSIQFTSICPPSGLNRMRIDINMWKYATI